jgi:alpha-1,2-mannosyltransferase
MVSYPVLTGSVVGQIDTLLIAAIVADLVTGPRWNRYRGILLGLTIAMKLTPAVFLLYFALRRDWRSAARSVLSATGATLLGLLFLPGASLQYWGTLVWDPTRVGKQTAALNQSLAGVVSRAVSPEAQVLDGGARVVWLVGCLLIVAMGAVTILRLVKSQATLTAVCVTALVGLLISPISWMHHWAWAPLLVIALAATAIRCRSLLAASTSAIGLVAMNIAPQWLFGSFWAADGYASWGPIAQILGSSLTWWGILTIPVISFLVRRNGPGFLP